MKSITFLALLFLIIGGCSTSKQSQLLNDVKELSSDKYKGRKTGSPENVMAADYIMKRMKEMGLKAYNNAFKKPFTTKSGSVNSVEGTNLVGYIQGKKSDVIVISAHYDHLGVINGDVYNGADDNASGIGGLLSIASYFLNNPPEHTLVFAAFDAEEQGLLGAKAFLANPTIPLGSINLNINMDMISRSSQNELYVAGTYHFPIFKNYIQTKNTEIKLIIGHDDPALGKDDWTNLSDHGAFYEKRIPFLYFGVEDHPDYHKASDDFERIDKKFFTNTVEVITEIVKKVDKGLIIQKAFKDKLIMKE